MTSWRAIHLAAAREAGRAHRDLGIDTENRIDPFAALTASGVVTLRRPLDRAAGLYLPPEGQHRPIAGVLVNVLHPLAKQRYTAAHELAHHRRDDRAVIDTETEWLGRDGQGHSDRERFAEAFAAWFLMPYRLLLATAARFRLELASASPEDVYQIALELGTSYQATAHHLRALQVIDAGKLRRFLALSPRSFKAALGARRVASNLRRDVWHLATRGASRQVRPQPGDILVIDVAEVPSAGYTWVAEVPAGVALINDEYPTPGDEEVVGATLLHRFRFLVRGAGLGTLGLSLSRPWERLHVSDWFIPVSVDERPAAGIVDPRLLVASDD